jgi:hypothetical protein
MGHKGVEFKITSDYGHGNTIIFNGEKFLTLYRSVQNPRA